ncbi:hypothetical protein F2P81_010713 [Scophthalmus maximus]|uniref:Uncharacterized protein n=1 Tax=Scophthalmus maximus TaxID=52904 RepID=A0A6A4SYP6_SCOMX|nr:hypothetical protein F2P81_010713 [Scophthalmus maximus]
MPLCLWGVDVAIHGLSPVIHSHTVVCRTEAGPLRRDNREASGRTAFGGVSGPHSQSTGRRRRRKDFRAAGFRASFTDGVFRSRVALRPRVWETDVLQFTGPGLRRENRHGTTDG